MVNKEFLCSMYDSNLVDSAIYNMATTVENLINRTGASEICDNIQWQMVYSYLDGANYAVEHKLTSTAPSKETFSEFHKNIDFAVLFNFSDNDFSSDMQAAAKTYCDEFNRLLHQIDMYADQDLMKSGYLYLQEFEAMCKIEYIKEIMKCGFLAQRMQNCAKLCCGRMPEADAALESIKRDLDYIPWDEDKSLWKKVDGKYVETEKFPRFITGTYAEIAEALKKQGEPFDDQTNEFPVWCNGEVVILYMKNGYLTYLIR